MQKRKFCQSIISLILISIITGCSSNPASPTITSPSNTAAVETAVSETNSPFSENKVKQYDDVRGLDLSNQVLGEDFIKTLIFDQTTIWSEKDKKIAQDIFESGKNLTFRLKELHEEGITGKGVNVAIIDLNMNENHPEFKGKIIKYVDLVRDSSIPASFHGPAVTSILGGQSLGVAPDVNIYFIAVPAWKLDAQYYADALNWIIKENESLSANEKIRVVSVSSIPSGMWSDYTNQQKWDDAYKQATEAGILVLDCTSEHGYTLSCTYDLHNPDNAQKCVPNWIPSPRTQNQRVNVPTSRTVAQEIQINGEDIHYEYAFTGYGALSWSVPYLAGLLALGWQINPELSNEKILDFVFESAYTSADGQRIINPTGFIDKVKSTVPAQ